MSIRSSRAAGRRAVAAIFATSLLAGGTAVVLPQTASAQQTDTPATTATTVSPDNSEVGADEFTKTCVAVPSGLYQSVYGPSTTSLYVTRAAGTTSQILKLDATTLETQAAQDVDTDDKGNPIPVYGIGLDDSKGYVWATNTRQNTVAIYDAHDLHLVKQYPADTPATHSRDVVVDQTTHKAYVSVSVAPGGVAVFDGSDLDAAPTSIALPDFGSTMALDVDQATGKLFTVSRDKPLAAVIDTRNGNAVTMIELPADKVDSGAGITYDPVRHNIWVASQTTNNVVVFNLDSKKVVAVEETGAGALNAKFDPATDLVYVVNRGGGTVTVFDAATFTEVGNLAAGADAVLGQYGNHVSVDGLGDAFTVNKYAATTGPNANTNQVCRITPKPGAFAPAPLPALPELPHVGS